MDTKTLHGILEAEISAGRGDVRILVDTEARTFDAHMIEIESADFIPGEMTDGEDTLSINLNYSATHHESSVIREYDARLARQDALLEKAADIIAMMSSLLSSVQSLDDEDDWKDWGNDVIDAQLRVKPFTDRLTSRNHSERETGGLISISERLPEIGQHVALVTTERYWCTPDGLPDMHVSATGYLANDGDHKYWAIFGERGMELNAFTHWKDLSDSCRLIEDGNKE